jgi:hypothetical protein
MMDEFYFERETEDINDDFKAWLEYYLDRLRVDELRGKTADLFEEWERSQVDRVVRVLIVGLNNPIENKQGYYWCCPAEPYMREIESEEGLFDTKQAAQALAKSKGWVLLERICQNSK